MKGRVGVFISCLAEYTTAMKKRERKAKRGQEKKGNERQTRRDSAQDVKTEVFE